MKVCSTPGCPNIHRNVGSKCDDCQAKANQAHWSKTRAYNTKGHRQRFRLGVLSKNPICVLCSAAQSVVADHFPQERTELVELGLDPNDPIYGRGLCLDCDKRQSAARQPGGWNNRA